MKSRRVEPDRAEWTVKQQRFWDAAAIYYSSLYKDGWSQAEDLLVLSQLRGLVKAGHRVVDLGCGQGLALRLMQSEHLLYGLYIGVDLSAGMLSDLSNTASELILQADICNLPLQDGSVDVVICVNSSISYLLDPELAIREISRVLAPNGRYLVMCLSRWSLRRLIRLRFRRLEAYGTGMMPQIHPTTCAAPVYLLSRMELRRLLHSNGLSVSIMLGRSPFNLNGRYTSWTWTLSQLLGRIFPNFGHTLVTLGSKQSH